MKDNLKDVGIWGQRNYQYLKERKPSVIGVMRLNGSLNAYLQQVNEQADEMCYRLVKQMAKDEGVTEELKRRDQMAWVGAMNAICERFKHLLSLMGKNRDNLSDTLTEQQKENLAKYDDAVNEMNSIAEEAAFHCGFSLGVRLVMECISIKLTED